MHVIKLQSKLREYEAHFLDDNGFMVALQRHENCVYVIDSNVWRIYAGTCFRDIPRADLIIFPVSEDRKCLRSVEELYEKFMERSAKKNMTLISIGGGIVQDVTGFTACTLYRGINWVFVPTTLLAQADSCIGSKTSLNFRGFKNLAGTFYPPSQILIYPPFLKSLEIRDYLSGLGEVAKLHVMGGEQMTSHMIEQLPLLLERNLDSLENAIFSSLQVKQNYMEGDEFDAGRRNLLNFGHCFGHALESTSNYSIPHGTAVVLGMMFANLVAKSRELLSAEKCDFLNNQLFAKLLVSSVDPENIKYDGILKAMKQDKKRVGEGLVIVLMKDDHTFVKVVDFAESELAASLEEYTKFFKTPCTL
ncbi:MAG: hypothetical protein H6Q57_276 [Geobacteraceae bacterium]|nr:hypothetical protein [Geobacteraceae bacterium]